MNHHVISGINLARLKIAALIMLTMLTFFSTTDTHASPTAWSDEYIRAGWESTSIALDSLDRPHISYISTTYQLRYPTGAPRAVGVTASDPDGHFSVTINAKGAPVTSWTEISTTNIAFYTVDLTDGDMVMVIEGQLEDPSLPGQIVLQVDPPGDIITYEINIHPRIPWDITGPTMWVPDGKCDMRDVALICKLYGSLEGDGKYDVRADITGPTYLAADGKIDIRDIALVCKHFGEIY